MFPKTGMGRTWLIFTLSLMIICFIRIVSCQVTFSRDWNPGKRSISGEGNCLRNLKSVTATFHLLMNELKYLSACKARAMVKFFRTQDEIFSDKTTHYGGR